MEHIPSGLGKVELACPVIIMNLSLCNCAQYFYGLSRRLKTELEDNSTTVVVHVEWTVSRKTDAKDASGITTKVKDIHLLPFVNGAFNPARQTLADMLSINASSIIKNATITLLNAFPKFLKVTGRNTDVVPQLMRLRKFDCWMKKLAMILSDHCATNFQHRETTK